MIKNFGKNVFGGGEYILDVKLGETYKQILYKGVIIIIHKNSFNLK